MQGRKGRGTAAFTLIELLVVITIIGVLAALVLAALAFSRNRARDAARLVDLKNIATVLEMYNLDEGHYPLSVNWASGCSEPGANWIPNGSDYGWSARYVSSMPRDPLENCSQLNQHTYGYTSDGLTYQITTELEGSAPPDIGGQNYAFNGSFFEPIADGSPINVAFSSSAGNPTNQSPIPIMVFFSRAVVDFTQSAFGVVRGIISGFSQVLATAYELYVTPTDNDTVIVSLTGGALHDSGGTGNAPAQFTITYDSLLPHIALSPDPLPQTVSGPFLVHANFTVPVTHFDVSDVVVQNGNASNLTGSGTDYDFTVTPSVPGSVSVQIPSNVAHSAAGNGNVASNSLSTNF